MPLYSVNDFYSGYRSNPGQFDIRNFEIYSDRNEHIGRVLDTLLDQAGNLQYLVVELATRGAKQVLLSTQQAHIDPQSRYIYLIGLSPRQADRLPAYHSGSASLPVSSEPVQSVYRMRSLEESAPLEASAPLEGYYVASTPAPVNPPVPSPPPPIPPYTPAVEPAAVQPVPPAVEYHTQAPEVVPSPPPVVPPAAVYRQERQEAIAPPPAATPDIAQEEVIPLLEERLIVDQKKRKVGEVIVRKEIETEIIEVPVQREKLIVEQVGPEPKQLAEIDLTEEPLSPVSRQEVQLPKIPKRDS